MKAPKPPSSALATMTQVLDSNEGRDANTRARALAVTVAELGAASASLQ